MKMRILFAGLTLATLTISASPAQAKNILVIIVDDMAVDKVSSYAADVYPPLPSPQPAFLPNTQAIDSLAAAGLRFNRAWATPLCSPTRASFQTGVFPFRHGVGTALKEGLAGLDIAAQLTPMLAQSFSDSIEHYKTGFFGKWHIGTEDAAVPPHTGYPVITTPPFGFAIEPHPSLAGWDRFYGIYDGYPGPGRSFTDWPRVSWLSSGTGYYNAHETQYHLTDATSKIARDWISQQSDPWLAVVAFSAPHSLRRNPESWQYGDADVTRTRTPNLCLTPGCPAVDEAKVVYQALAEHVDLEIDDLLNKIPEAVMENTLIVFFGDNGTPQQVQEPPFDDGRGKDTVYENGIRVPLIVADGATWLNGTAGAIVTPGLVVEAGVTTTDVYQTIHDYALTPVTGVVLDSRSFTDCFTTTDSYCDRFGRQYGYSEKFVANGSISSAQIAVRYGNDKMIATYDPVLGCLDETFYETATNPFETIPQPWTGNRANRLRDYFTNLHTPAPTSWAYANGPLVGFCP